MFKTIFASALIFALATALVLGLNGSIDPVAMVVFSLVSLGLFYGLAIRTAVVNIRI
jgi:hypothetical protein